MKIAGREPLTVVEIDQDLCPLVYGEAPCAAALGVTGIHKCYNTRRTCQDAENYGRIDDGEGEPVFAIGTLTLRFCVPCEDTGLPKSVPVIPSVVSVDTVPTEINIGASGRNSSPLGRRARVTVTFRDHPYHDRLVDPYWQDRDFDPATRGTFWAKWLARNPYYQGRRIRIYEGYVGQSLAEMRVRNYIIERIDGPSGGQVRLTAKDPIKLLDSERAQAPQPSNGILTNDIDDAADELILSPDGIGDEEYPASGIARVGNELMAYTRAGDTITIGSRGLRGSSPADHDQGDTFQQVLVIESVRVDELIRDLITDFAGVPAEFIPYEDWQEEADRWLGGFDLSVWIAQPTGVAQLVNEILEQVPCFLWWDEFDQLIQFRAMRPFYPLTDSEAVPLSDDSNLVAGSVKIEERPDERISQVWIYYDQIDPLKSATDSSNFRRLRIRSDRDAESANEYGERRIREIFARFLTSANDAAAVSISARKIARDRDSPRIVSFSLDAKDRESVRTATVVLLNHRDLVDFTGQPETRRYQVFSVEESEPGHRIECLARPYEFGGRYAFIMANDSPVYSDALPESKNFGCWIAPDADGFSDGGEAYRII